jgi:hypothetical protein
VDFYRENGPSVVAAISLVHPSNSFKLDGFLALLVGQCVPHDRPYPLSPREREFWRQRRETLRKEALTQGMTAEEVIAVLRRPGLKWS